MSADKHKFYESLLHNSPAATVFLDTDGRVITCNPAFCTLFEYNAKEVIGTHLDTLVADEEMLAEATEFTKRMFEKQETVSARGWRRSKSGRLIEVDMQGVPVIEREETQGVLFIYNDISALMKAEQKSQNVYSSFSTILDSLEADVYVSDMRNYEILFMNQNMQANFGGNYVGQSCYKVFRRESEPCPHCSNHRLQDENGESTGVYIWEGENPVTKTWYRNYDRAIPWYDGRDVRLEIAFDITDLKKAKAGLEHMATHDALTSLPNRVVFRDRLSHALSIAQRGKTEIAVLFIDLDGFKLINDNFGHSCGDDFLRILAKRMLSVLRQCDTVARISGDEFGVVLERQANPKEARKVAQRLLEVIATPVDFKGGEAAVTASIGIATYPANGKTPDDLISQADEAMYTVKKQNKNGFCMAIDSK